MKLMPYEPPCFESGAVSHTRWAKACASSAVRSVRAKSAIISDTSIVPSPISSSALSATSASVAASATSARSCSSVATSFRFVRR